MAGCSQRGAESGYRPFSRLVRAQAQDSVKWQFAIFLDVNACLTCADDVPSWLKLEEQLPSQGGELSLWTTRNDSSDVAIGLGMEGLRTPVHAIDSSLARKWGLLSQPNPIKVFVSRNGKPLKVVGPFSGPTEARHFYSDLLAKLGSR
jgi:hypothetical protein